MKKEQGAIVDRRGNAVGAVAVTVYNTGTAVKPTIYSDNGITPQANPFNTDSMGRWAFYVANGRYDINFSGATINAYTLVDVLVEDAAVGNAVTIQGHAVNEAAIGDDRILVYKTAGDQFVYEDKGAPSAHASSHQNGGGDEISVDGLAGVLADPQTPASHAASHQDGGGDELSVDGLSGALADPQTPASHAISHQDGGGDEISVANLAGQLAEKQDANKIQGHTVDETALGNDKFLVYKTTGDKFVYESKSVPSIHATSHQNGGGDEISVEGLSGQLGERQDADKIQGYLIDVTNLGNDKVLVFKTATSTYVFEPKGTPAGHHEAHELGGGDQIDCTGLTGASGGGGGGDFLVVQVFS